MSTKLKALGLALLASLAIGAVGVVSATGSTGGHFTSDAEGGWTVLDGHQEGGEANFLEDVSAGTRITCPDNVVTYLGSLEGATDTEMTLKPSFGEGCTYDGGFGGSLEWHTGTCEFVITAASSGPNHTAVHLVCDDEEDITVTADPVFAGECIIHIPPQTPTSGGVVLTTAVHNEKHGLTIDLTLDGITMNKTEVGFLGCAGDDGEQNDTNMRGTITLTGFDTDESRVNITSTGPDA